MNKPIGLLSVIVLTAGLVACEIGVPEDPDLDAGTAQDGSNPSGRDGSSDGQPDAGSASRDASTGYDAGRADASQPGSPDSGVPGKDAGSNPPAHDLRLGGIAHKSGNTDPLKNCVSCHGATLKGGQGPSCYKCHDASDHTKSRGGKKHQTGSSTSCNDCHGPGNSGGIGPACTTCHAHQ